MYSLIFFYMFLRNLNLLRKLNIIHKNVKMFYIYDYKKGYFQDQSNFEMSLVVVFLYALLENFQCMCSDFSDFSRSLLVLQNQ